MVIIRLLATFIIFFLMQGCSPPSAIVKSYVHGKPENNFVFNGNTCYFKAHTKQLSAIYIDYWFNIKEDSRVFINPEGLKVILKNKSYDYGVSDKNGYSIITQQPVIEGDTYTINSYFDNTFLNTNDTIIVEINGFIIIDDRKPNLPPINILIDSISR